MVSYNSVGVRRHNEMCGLILASLEQKRIAHSRGDPIYTATGIQLTLSNKVKESRFSKVRPRVIDQTWITTEKKQNKTKGHVQCNP